MCTCVHGAGHESSGKGPLLWWVRLEGSTAPFSLNKLRRNTMNLGQEEGGSSQTPEVSLERARSLALLVPMASLGPSVLHKGGGEGRSASGTPRLGGHSEPRSESRGERSLRAWSPFVL